MGMGAEVAVRKSMPARSCSMSGGAMAPKDAFNFTMASVAVTDKFLAERADDAKALKLAIGDAHQALKKNISLITDIGRKIFSHRTGRRTPLPASSSVTCLIIRRILWP